MQVQMNVMPAILIQPHSANQMGIAQQVWRKQNYSSLPVGVEDT